MFSWVTKTWVSRVFPRQPHIPESRSEEWHALIGAYVSGTTRTKAKSGECLALKTDSDLKPLSELQLDRRIGPEVGKGQVGDVHGSTLPAGYDRLTGSGRVSGSNRRRTTAGRCLS